MNGQGDLLTAAALLERAYRLALVLQDGVPPDDAYTTRFVAAELMNVLDEARVALLGAITD